MNIEIRIEYDSDIAGLILDRFVETSSGLVNFLALFCAFFALQSKK